MAIVTVQKPDSLSMSGNLKELVLQSVDPVSVVLRAAGAIVLEETFYPGNGNLIHIGLTEVVKSHLSFTLPSSDVFIQPNLSKDFTVAYGEDSYTFRCIRSGKMHLNESATQFLTGNFLTWQPTQKAVTYYSPEWLTYYAPEDCTVRLRAYWEDGTNSTISLSGQSSGTCVSYNLQYAVIAGKFAGKRPMYYDVWVENPSGTRLSYVQRYVASEKQGEDENWYLFENSLGGIDSLRAYGALKDDPEYTHNLAVFGDESEEYRIDTNRLLTRNTGMLTPEEARWLQDMFVASRKYVYTLSGLYRIVFTSSNAKTDSANPPVSYSFTYRLSDGRPYLDIQRRTDLPENLVIPIPTGDTFFLPPRLAEFPKPTLSPDLLIPVQEPHTEVWGATTTGQIHDTVLNDLIRELDGLDLNPIQGEGGINVDIIKLNDLTIPSDTNVFSALRTLKEIADATDGLLVEVNDMFLRKDIDDTAHGNILFDKKIGSSIFIDGWEGKGWEIQSTGAAILDSLRVRSDIYIGGRMGSPSFISGFPEGTGWDLSPYTITNSAGVKETRYRLEIDDIVARKSARFYEMIISQLRGENDNVMFSGQMKVAYYDSAAGRLYLDTELGILYNPFRPGDLLEVQRYNGIPSSDNNYYITKQYELQVEEVGIGPLADGEDRLDWITFKNFVGNLSQIAEGDVLTRVDSATDSTRKGIVKITTIDELGTPHISAIYGMKTNPDDSLLARLGNCAGVRTKNGIQLTEQVGLYARGAFFENSTIVLQNGDTIEQTFIAMNGKFESLIDSIRNDISAEGGNILVNSSFSQNTNYWTAANNVHFINVGGEYLWLDGSFYVEKDQVADIYNDNGQNVLRIRNTYILQQNAIMNIPDHTEEEEKTYSFSLFYKVLRPGSCGFGIPGTELYHEEQLSESDSYQKLSKVGKWNGKGDFELRFTGEILIYGVGLFSDEIADAIVKLQTQIDQTDEYIKLLATKDYVDNETGEIYVHFDSQLQITAEQMSGISTKVDNINNTIESAGWITQADAVSLFASKNDLKTLETSVANLSVEYDQISSAVGTNTQGIKDAADLANKAFECGLYSQEQYSQTNDPWQSWPSGQEFKHVGALWYNPSTKITKRYIGVNGTQSWETVNDNAVSAASFVLQNKDKWRVVVANFDADGNPTEESGIMTTAYGNNLYARKDNIISSINQSPESITLEASKINLKGATQIGSFTITEYGWFKCNASPGEDVGYIDMIGENTRIAFGRNLAPLSTGGSFTCTAIIKNHNKASSGGTTYGLSVSASGDASTDVKPIAVDCDGGLRVKGNFGIIEDVFTGPNIAPSDSSFSSAKNLRNQRTYIYQPTSDITVNLPSDSAIKSEFGHFNSGHAVVDNSAIIIILLVTKWATGRIYVAAKGGTNNNIINENGDTINEASGSNTGFWMGKGDSAILMYFNKNWYIINRNS